MSSKINSGELDSEQFESLSSDPGPKEPSSVTSARLSEALNLWRGQVPDRLQMDKSGRADVTSARRTPGHDGGSTDRGRAGLLVQKSPESDAVCELHQNRSQ